jgi:hypothetical protein
MEQGGWFAKSSLARIDNKKGRCGLIAMQIEQIFTQHPFIKSMD